MRARSPHDRRTDDEVRVADSRQINIMSEFDDYEALPETSSVAIHMTAGAAAGVMEHCVMYPIDCVKTRMQSLVCEKQHVETSIFRSLRTIVREEGIFRPVRGVQAMALGAGPAHALYFSCYEKLKDVFTSFSTRTSIPDFACHGVAGTVATLLHDGIMTPAEVVKQRMQMCCSPWTSCLGCARDVFQNEGARAFYRSYTTQLTMNIPFQATHFMTYEFMQTTLNPDKQYMPVIHFIAGATAGAVASTATMPLDVCKTLLNTQEAGVLRRVQQTEIVGLVGAARTIYRVTGFNGYFQGLRARVLYQMPSTAISWSVYEFFKHYLKSRATGADQQYDSATEVLHRSKEDPATEIWESMRKKSEVVAENVDKVQG